MPQGGKTFVSVILWFGLTVFFVASWSPNSDALISHAIVCPTAF